MAHRPLFHRTLDPETLLEQLDDLLDLYSDILEDVGKLIFENMEDEESYIREQIRNKKWEIKKNLPDSRNGSVAGLRTINSSRSDQDELSGLEKVGIGLAVGVGAALLGAALFGAFADGITDSKNKTKRSRPK